MCLFPTLNINARVRKKRIAVVLDVALNIIRLGHHHFNTKMAHYRHKVNIAYSYWDLIILSFSIKLIHIVHFWVFFIKMFHSTLSSLHKYFYCHWHPPALRKVRQFLQHFLGCRLLISTSLVTLCCSSSAEVDPVVFPISCGWIILVLMFSQP